MTNELAYEILAVVGEIPLGRVATYGQIAALAGLPRHARLVGRILSHAEFYGDYPCHRVVNAAGRLVPGWADQALLLREEGVPMKDDTHVDLSRCRWQP